MTLGEYILHKSNGTTFDEKVVLGESGKILGFDASLNPIMVERVPYTGATGDVDLGVYAQKVAKLKLKTDGSNTLAIGELGWNIHDKTLEVKLDNNVTLQIGQEQNLPLQNNTGSTLLNGRLVRVTGHDIGTEYYTIEYSDCSSEATAYVDFMLTEDIADGSVGFGTKTGIVHDINTTGGTLAGVAYLSTNGQFSSTAPSYPNKTVIIGLYGHISGTVGEMLVDFNRANQYNVNTIHNSLELKMNQNPGIDQASPVLVNDIVIDTTGLTLTIATINGGTTITPANPVRFFTDGGGIVTKWEKTSAVTFPTFTNTTGIWYFYFDSSGNPITTQIAWSNFATIAPIYRFYWNATLSGADRLVIEAFEAHQNDISASDHAWKHAQGSIYESGLEITSNLLVSGAPNVDGRNTCLSLSTGKCSDDGLEWTVTNTTSPTNYFDQNLGEISAVSLTSSNSGLFKIRTNDTGGLLSLLPATRFPFLWNSGNNRPQYLTSLGVATDVPDANYFIYYLYNLSDRGPGNAVKLVSAQTSFSTLISAQSHNWETLRALYPTLKDNEIRPLYKVTFYVKHSNPQPFDAACKYTVIREIADIRTQKTTTSVASAGSTLASNVVYAPTSPLTSTNVQSALDEVAAALVASGGMTLINITSNYTAPVSNETIICQTPVIVSLPQITGTFTKIINNNSNGTIIVVPFSGDTIKNDGNLSIEFTNSTAQLISSLSTKNWTII